MLSYQTQTNRLQLLILRMRPRPRSRLLPPAPPPRVLPASGPHFLTSRPPPPTSPGRLRILHIPPLLLLASTTFTLSHVQQRCTIMFITLLPPSIRAVWDAAESWFRQGCESRDREEERPTKEREGRESERLEEMPASPWRWTRTVGAKGCRKIQPKFWSVETVCKIAIVTIIYRRITNSLRLRNHHL